jgi:hypothetical protein
LLIMPVNIEVDEYMNLLAVYTELLKKNAHFTILSDNPSAAFEIYNILARNESNPEKRSDIIHLRGEFWSIWIKEITKFNERFGLFIDPVVL